MDLDLAQVRAFVAVVDHAHFGRAAESLMISQQALSKRLARLEAGLGRLLVRERGGTRPTQAGELFLPSARHLVEVADRAVEQVRDLPGPPLRIDVWSDLQSPARLVRAIALDHPELVVELGMRRDLGQAIAALERHEIDLAFGDVDRLPRPLPESLSAELVLFDEIALLVSDRSPLAARAEIDPGELSRIWFPLAGSSAELRRFAQEYAAAVDIELVAVGANVGLAELVARVAADPEIVTCVVADWPVPSSNGVRMVRLRPPPRYPWCAVWRTDAVHPGLHQVLAEVRSRVSGGSGGPSCADAEGVGGLGGRGSSPRSSRTP